ncbi:RHS repeat-associated core domain-containing protein [Pseudomonas putida]|jgi:RHS repeat-associated protein
MDFFYQAGLLRTMVGKANTFQLFGQARQTQALRLNTADKTGLLATDGMLTPSAVVSVNTRQILTHTAFGYMQLSTGQPVGFNGERIDPHSGMYALGQGYRSYSTTLMRFTRPDSVSPFSRGGINCYAYVQNDPVNRFDPDGRSFKFQLESKLKFKKFNNLSKKIDIGTDHKGRDIGVYETLGERKPKLIINAHGTPDSVIIGNTILSPRNLMTWLSSRDVHPQNYRNITLLSCTTGYGLHNPSFAQQLANISNVKVKAPTGILVAKTQKNSNGTEFAIGMLADPGVRQLRSIPESAKYGVSHKLQTFKPDPKAVRNA